MRSRRASAEHQEAVARRLALLSAELAAERPPAWGPPPETVSEAASDAASEPTLEPDWTSGHTRIRPRTGTSASASASTEPPTQAEPLTQAESPTQAERPSRAEPMSRAGPPPVPVPGRHAARRPRTLAPAPVDLVPETLRGRAALGSAQLTVVAVVVALGLAVTCWWVVRGDPGAPVAPAPVDVSPVADLVEVPPVFASASGPGPATAESGTAGAPTAEVVVDVAGKVRRPGIVVLDAGARVVDALEAAGGARPGVDLSSLNLARLLVDGEQVLVGQPAVAVPVPGGTGATGATGATGVPAAPVDLNRATPVELEALPEVGPVTAAAIVAWRDQHGGFSAVEELLEVDGIGEATLAQLQPFVTVAGG